MSPARRRPRPRLRRALRAAVVAFAVVVLAPAWAARSAWLYACAMDREVRAERCCPNPGAAEPGDERPDPSPGARPACCAPGEVPLAGRDTTAAHDAPALPAPDAVVIAEVAAPAAPSLARAAEIPPRATGPPTYLRKLALLR